MSKYPITQIDEIPNYLIPVAEFKDILEALELGLKTSEDWIHCEYSGTSLIGNALKELQPIRDSIKKAKGEP